MQEYPAPSGERGGDVGDGVTVSTQITIPVTTAKDHARLVGEYEKATEAHRDGSRDATTALMRRCIVLALIRKKETWKASSSSFEDFVEKDLGIKRAYGHRLASAGPMCSQLIESVKKNKSTIVDFRIEHFKPIAGMDKRYPNAYAKQQARCLEQSHKLATQRDKPMTANLVAEVAEERFDFLPRSKWKEKQKREPTHAEVMERLKGHLEDAFLVLAEIGLTADEIVEEFGSPADLRGYLDAYPLMCDLYEHV